MDPKVRRGYLRPQLGQVASSRIVCADEQQFGRSFRSVAGRDVSGNLEKLSASLVGDLIDFSASLLDVAFDFGGEAGGGWSNCHNNKNG